MMEVIEIRPSHEEEIGIRSKSYPSRLDGLEDR